MGVPITFLDKYNPEQFEIIGLINSNSDSGIKELKKYDEYIEMRTNGSPTGSSGKKTNGNPILKESDMLENKKKGNYYYHKIKNEKVYSLYSRITIKSKNHEN